MVAFPTETVYGLGACARDKKAAGRIYKIKKRPLTKPLAIQIADVRAIGEMGCVVTPAAKKLMDRFWPGPLTIILKGRLGKKIGFRMPANKAALELLRKAAVPLAVPSANISGKPPARNAEEVLAVFRGRIEAVLDGGHTDIGVASTVVDMTGASPKVLRDGAIPETEILDLI